jgi:hypothetical protein
MNGGGERESKQAPAGLVKERSDLRIDRVIGSAPEPAFLGARVSLTRRF